MTHDLPPRLKIEIVIGLISWLRLTWAFLRVVCVIEGSPQTIRELVDILTRLPVIVIVCLS